MKTLVGVIGAQQAPQKVLDIAEDVGREIVRSGFSLICGGLTGVMEAACRGAYSEAGPDSGHIIGILPGIKKAEANPYVDIAISTGMGYARNAIIACAADALIAVSGGSGTMSEIAIAWQYGKPIIVIENLPGISKELIGKSLDNRRYDTIIGAKDASTALEIVRKLIGKD